MLWFPRTLGLSGSSPSFRAHTLWVGQAGGTDGAVRSGDEKLRVGVSCLRASHLNKEGHGAQAAGPQNRRSALSPDRAVGRGWISFTVTGRDSFPSSLDESSGAHTHTQTF